MLISGSFVKFVRESKLIIWNTFFYFNVYNKGVKSWFIYMVTTFMYVRFKFSCILVILLYLDEWAGIFNYLNYEIQIEHIRKCLGANDIIDIIRENGLY